MLIIKILFTINSPEKKKKLFVHNNNNNNNNNNNKPARVRNTKLRSGAG